MVRGNIPQEWIEAVLKSHDIVETVGKYVHLTKRGKNYVGRCPFHSEKTPSFSVSPERQIFHCFGCGVSGTSITFVMEMDGLSFPEAVREMAEEAGIELPHDAASAEESAERKHTADLFEAHELAAKWFHYVLKNTDYGIPAMDYLKRRGFTHKLIDDFQVGYAPNSWDLLTQFVNKRGFDLTRMEQGGLLSRRQGGDGFVDRFRDRIMFPIRDHKGRTVAFGGRVLGEGQPKYLNSPETPIWSKSRLLYNLHEAKQSIRKTSEIVLLEGYVDVIKSSMAGVTNGVATLGTALTEQHANIMKRNADHVRICYDGDNAGQNAALKSIPILQAAGLRVTVCALPDRMDPDEYISAYGPERFVKEVVEGSASVIAFRLRMMRRSYRLQDQEDRLRYIRAAVKLIGDLDFPTEREHYLKELSEEFGYALETLKQEVAEYRTKAEKKWVSGDKNEIPWNTGMNEKRTFERDIPPLRPAYYNAERQLLHVMMQDRDAAITVQSQLGDAFNTESHAALAAYLYAYYAEHDHLHLGTFLSALQDADLEREASSISLMELDASAGLPVLDELIEAVRRQSERRPIDRLRDEARQAVLSGDDIRAAQIEVEILALERKLK